MYFDMGKRSHIMPKIEISDDALAYFKAHAEPLVDTTVTIVDRIISEHKQQKSRSAVSLPAANIEMHFSSENLPSVKFTSILKATIAGKPASQNYWNSILEDVISTAVKSGVTSAEVRANLMANIFEGEKTDSGYRYISDLGFSYQGIEANRVLKNIAKLCSVFRVPVDISFKWQDNDDAAHPRLSARVVLP